MAVDFPAPLRPSRATVSPRGMVRSMPSTARTGPKDRVTPVKATAVSFVMGTTLRIGGRGPAGVDVRTWP